MGNNKFAIINILDKVGCLLDTDSSIKFSIADNEISIWGNATKLQQFAYIDMPTFSCLINSDNVDAMDRCIVENENEYDHNIYLLLSAYDWETRQDFATVLRVGEIER